MNTQIGDPDPSHSMDQLAQLIWGNEILYGTATRIGNDGTHTVIVFDTTKPAPAPVDASVRVVLAVAGAAKPAGATTLLCTGEAFVRSARTKVDVYRR
jgi:hypothetical protein